MEYHIHGGDDIRQTFLLLTVEGAFLQDVVIFHTLDLLLHIKESFAKETSRTTSRVINRFAYLRINHLDDAANQRTWCVILTTVTASITHSLDIALIEHRHFVLVLSTLEVELINHVDNLTHIESRANLVMQLSKDFANLIFQAIRLGCCVLKVFEVREELLVNKLHEVVATHSINGIQYHLACLRVFLLGRSPLAPTIEA